MRCFSCDNKDAENLDGLTGRYYCTSCLISINEQLYWNTDDDIVLDGGFEVYDEEKDYIDTPDVSDL